MWKELRQGLTWEVDFGCFSVSIHKWGDSEYGAYMDGDTFIGKSESLDGAKAEIDKAIRFKADKMKEAITKAEAYLESRVEEYLPN